MVSFCPGGEKCGNKKNIEDVLFAFECHMTRKIGQPGKVDRLGKRVLRRAQLLSCGEIKQTKTTRFQVCPIPWPEQFIEKEFF